MSYFVKEPHPPVRIGGNTYLVERFRDTNVFEVLETLNNACYVDPAEDEAWKDTENLIKIRDVGATATFGWDSEGTYLSKEF